MPGTNGQSALYPAGSDAQWIMDLTWVMTIGATIIFIIVMLLVWMAVRGPAALRGIIASRAMIMAGGVAFPVVVLTALLAWGLAIARDIRVSGQEPAVRIEVSGEQWWWRVTYLDGAQRPLFATGNEIHLPAGSEAAFSLVSPDVIHSFWIPSLGGKLDMIPGRTNSLIIRPERPGVYRGQCAEFCGAQHALMSLIAVVETPEDYAAWFENQMQPAREPQTAEQQLGMQLFGENGCGACHAIRGTEWNGMVGPDLTHVGSRKTLGAATFPNNRGTLAGWISSAQHLKPGNKMPSFDRLTGVELRALAAYLEALK